MPEGDTIFRAARTLHRALAGHAVARFETTLAPLARVHDDAPITGRVVERVDAMGKHLLMHFTAARLDGERPPAGAMADALVLRTHMRMSGSWHVYRPGEAWQRSPRSARIVVGTSAFVAVAFAVPVAEFVPAARLGRHAVLGTLGPDVLKPDFDERDAARRRAASTRPTAAEALLQQQAVAGLGNVYKSELLFLAGVSPFAPPAGVSDDDWRGMMREARRLLLVNVGEAAGAARRTTGSADPTRRLFVYGRQGRPCLRCGTTIRMRRHGDEQRSTYWCPTCQPDVRA